MVVLLNGVRRRIKGALFLWLASPRAVLPEHYGVCVTSRADLYVTAYRTGHPCRSNTTLLSKTVVNGCPVNMAASRAFTFRLLPLMRGRFGPARSAARAFSCAAARAQLRTADGASASPLTGRVDRFGGVTVNLADVGLPAGIDESSFSGLLRGWSITTEIINM